MNKCRRFDFSTKKIGLNCILGQLIEKVLFPRSFFFFRQKFDFFLRNSMQYTANQQKAEQISQFFKINVSPFVYLIIGTIVLVFSLFRHFYSSIGVMRWAIENLYFPTACQILAHQKVFVMVLVVSFKMHGNMHRAHILSIHTG